MCPDRTKWSVEEELSLLKAVERHSYGNWTDIAKQIGTRSAFESKKEYVKQFIQGIIGKTTWSSVTRSELQYLTQTDDSPLGFTKRSSLPPLDVLPHEAQKLSYYPLRDVFEIEYDNQAETLISSLSLTGEDDDLDIALKLTQVDIYTERLRERKRRHRIVRDYQLIANFFRQKKNGNNKMSRVEASLQDQCLPFCQFFTSEEYKQFLGMLMSQYDLACRLLELLRYRRFGLTRFDQILDFEKENMSRQVALQKNTQEKPQLNKKKITIKHKKNPPRAKKSKC